MPSRGIFPVGIDVAVYTAENETSIENARYAGARYAGARRGHRRPTAPRRRRGSAVVDLASSLPCPDGVFDDVLASLVPH